MKTLKWCRASALIGLVICSAAFAEGQTPAAPGGGVVAPPNPSATRREYLGSTSEDLPATKKELARIRLGKLAPGETHLVEARIAARSTRSNSPENTEQPLYLKCGNGSREIRSSRNHEGNDFAGGTPYIQTPMGPVLTIRAHHLFMAPKNAKGSVDYTCTLEGRSESGRLTAVRSVRQGGRDVTGTWIQVVDQHKYGTEWVDMMMSAQVPESNCQPDDLGTRCEPRICPSADTGARPLCQYIFSRSEPRSERLLEMKVAKSDLFPRWEPGGTATVYADFELTSCYLEKGTENSGVSSSCNGPLVKNSDQATRRGEGGDSDVLYRLEVAELDDTGKPDACRAANDGSDPGWTYSPARGAGSNNGDYVRERISDGAHHQKFHRQLTRRLSNNPACTRILVRVHIRAARGHPIKVDANREGNVAFANGIIWLDTPVRAIP